MMEIEQCHFPKQLNLDVHLYETIGDQNKFDQNNSQIQALKWLKHEIDTQQELLKLNRETTEQLLVALGFLKKNHHTQDKIEFLKLWEILVK